jgi:predicted Zn-dependent peptidase
VTKITIPEIEQFKVNGINVVHIPNKLPISYVAIFAKAGSYLETPEEEGFSHFIEHMFFKGTETRTYKDIVQQGALLSADQNAYTSCYNVLYHLTLPYKNIEAGLDLLFDMYFKSVFPEEELKKERGVVLEEIKMYEDDHSAAYSTWYEEALFDRSIGHAVVGPQKNIRNISRDSIINFKNRAYGLDNTFILVAGPISRDKLVDAIKGFKHYYKNAPKNVNVPGVVDKTFIGTKDITKKRKNIQQTYYTALIPVPIGCHSITQAHRAALSALGGGMYSYLFDRVREQLGLCYSINAGILDSNDKQVVLGIQTLTEKADEAHEAINQSIQDILDNGIENTLFECAKADRLGDFYKGLCWSGSMANQLRQDLFFGGRVSRDKFTNTLKELESLTLSDVNRAFQDLLGDTDNIIVAKMVPA